MNPTTNLWTRWSHRFTVPGAPHNTPMTVVFTAPSGRTVLRDAFWDGDEVWEVRVIPDEEGRWRYLTLSSFTRHDMEGVSGGFTCHRVESDNLFIAHGPVGVSPDGTHFRHADGAPFFWLGDTVWTGPQLASKSDWDEFLDDRARKRFNAIQCVLTAPWRTAKTDENGEVSFTGVEQIKINPKYFQRLDQRMDAMASHGIVAVAVMLWAIFKEDAGQFLPEDQAIRLGRYLLARYGANPVLWILPGDANYVGEVAERWRRIGRRVFYRRAHAPVTLHPCGMNWPFDGFAEEPWLGYYGYQSGHGDDAKTVKWLQTGPPATKWRELPDSKATIPHRPVINLEPPYEDHISYQSRQRHSAYSTRRCCWWSLLVSPPAGVTYGGHGIWSWQTEEGLPFDHESTGLAQPWRIAKDLPGASQMTVLREIFESVDWPKLRPAQHLLASQPGEADPFRFVVAARTEDGAQAIVYIPVGETFELDASVAAMTAEWADPRTGERRPESSGTKFTPPTGEDWVLILSLPGWH